MRPCSRTSILLTLSLALTGLSLSAVPAAAVAKPSPAQAATPDGTTPIPTVQGPLASTAESYPFGAANHQEVPQDLSKLGYVEEEYLVSGTSNVYTWPAAGPAQIRTPDAPYTTRVLVRKPAKGQKFSGNVVVEMLNPSNLFDLNIGWAMAHEQITANGDAWVGITAKPIAVQALKNFDAERYASLSFANPLALTDPRNCATVAADSSRTTENGLIWDIYSQVGAWLKSDDPTNPLRYGSPATRVEHAYGFGYSQTGGFLVNYINGVHPLVVESDGEPIYDAYIVAVAGGAFAGAYPMNQCEPSPPATDVRRQFKDVGVPIMRIMSQSDYLLGIGSRRADSDAPGDQYRHYEMAGAGHATPDELIFSASSGDIIAAGRAVPPASCNEGPRSRFPSSIFFNAALRNLDLWVREGIAPPRAEPILVRDGAPVLDEFGNVQGGLRSPFLDAPTSTWYGTATGASFCFIAGYERPLPQAVIDGLYGDHGDYVKAVKGSVRELEDQAFLTGYDARQLLKENAQSKIP
ncbi:alpha/beta hydrolase domain-containing protein [Pseudarthrobacter sp. 1C304]|uniref:alpha/beta hydrolase domain-containing protein n=1 Tax=Pseudarthrobacter sp. 1C304 TaxID=3457438 RepID=UPI003FD4BE8D